MQILGKFELFRQTFPAAFIVLQIRNENGISFYEPDAFYDLNLARFPLNRTAYGLHRVQLVKTFLAAA